MRVACSLILSASLLFPGAALPLTQTTQDKNAKQAAQEPQPVALVVKQPLAFGLEDSTPVKLRINRNISSADAQVNETVDFEVLEEVKGGGHQGAITGAIVATSIVFFPAAPLFLLVHGKDITIPKGTEITAYINGDIPLDPKKFVTQTAINPEAGATTVQSSTDVAPAQNGNGLGAVFSTVEIKSTPGGAEITVDEKFMGSTPSSLRLAVGDHKIKLGKSGFKIWERTMTVSAGATATVDATLEKQE